MLRAEIDRVSTLAIEDRRAAEEYLSQYAEPGGVPPSEGSTSSPLTTAEVVSCAFLLGRSRLLSLGAPGVEYLLESHTKSGCWTDTCSADPWDVSSTAWAVSAILASGTNDCARSVALACDWLRASVLPSGGLPTNRRNRWANTYATAYGLRALAEAGDYTAAARCTTFIEESQNGDGGWGLACGDLSEPTLTSHVVNGLQDACTGANSVEGTAFSSYVLFRSMGIPQNIEHSFSFLAERVRCATAWQVRERNRPWITVSCMLLASAVLDASQLRATSASSQMIEGSTRRLPGRGHRPERHENTIRHAQRLRVR